MCADIKLPIERAKWTDVEVCQLLIAVYNMGEGDWVELQKRLDFTSSQVVKSPNEVALKYRTVKRLMWRDAKRLGKKERLFYK